jgi:transcriptional regulator of arginine metabolism
MPADTELRDARHRALRLLLERRRITTQSSLVARLREQGHEVTQSSISRDLSDLGAVKVGGAYRLPAPVADTDDEVRRLTFELLQGHAPAGDHLLVVKTMPGAAQIVGSAIDGLDLPEVVGTVAGDDTIFVATASRTGQRTLIHTLDSLAQGAPT